MKKLMCCIAALCVANFANSATITVVAPQEGAAKSVTVGGKSSATFTVGKSAALKATANTGWAFAGWYANYDADAETFSDEVALANAADWRSPSANYIAGTNDVTLYARFTLPEDDALSFDFSEVFGDERDDYDIPLLPLKGALDASIEFISQSFPTVTVTGLPSGLSFNKTSLRLTGKPSAPGVYKVVVSAKNASG